jgi:uncharacterized protein YxjI
MAQLNYPLKLTFKVLALGPQISVLDASGQERMYVHMKAFKLKEEINIYADKSKGNKLFGMKADKVIDFSATYNFTDGGGSRIGAVKREGMRSIFKASYNVLDTAGNITHHIKEDNGMIRVADMILQQIPIVGMFAGYFFNPTYTLYQSGTETPVLKLVKKPAFLEGSFELNVAQDPGADEPRLVLAFLMMTLLERMRG